MLEVNHFRASALIAVAALVAAGLLVLVGTKPAEAAFPGANGKIAFFSNRTTGAGVTNPQADYEIFAMNPDGTGLEQLTSNTENDYFPAWSADGNWMAFTSNQDGNPEIYMRTDGYFDHDSGHFVLGHTRRLTTNTASDLAPNWSPDGEQIAFTSTRDGNLEIYVMDSDGTDQTRLTNNTAASDEDPNWSPDGTKIAFTSFRDGNSDIYVMNATDGSELKRLTKKAADDYEPAWSPDGTKIAFQSIRGGDAEIYAMKAKPESKRNRPKNLTKNDFQDNSPDWRSILQP